MVDCGTTRARAWDVSGTGKLDSSDAVVALGGEVVEQGYPRSRPIVVPGNSRAS